MNSDIETAISIIHDLVKHSPFDEYRLAEYADYCCKYCLDEDGPERPISSCPHNPHYWHSANCTYKLALEFLERFVHE